jgi:hypothetical protein
MRQNTIAIDIAVIEKHIQAYIFIDGRRSAARRKMRPEARPRRPMVSTHACCDARMPAATNASTMTSVREITVRQVPGMREGAR